MLFNQGLVGVCAEYCALKIIFPYIAAISDIIDLCVMTSNMLWNQALEYMWTYWNAVLIYRMWMSSFCDTVDVVVVRFVLFVVLWWHERRRTGDQTGCISGQTLRSAAPPSGLQRHREEEKKLCVCVCVCMCVWSRWATAAEETTPLSALR